MAHKRARVLRVFLSHTSEFRDHPRGGSYVDAVERAVSAAGSAVVNMVDFPAADQRPSQVCSELVRESDVLISLIGICYGTPVVDRPAVSYTELEFDVATDAGVPRLVFMLDDEDPDVRMPAKALTDREHGAAQDAYRDRLRQSGVTIKAFSTPDNLETVVERSLRNLAAALEESTDEEVREDRRTSRTSLPATNLPQYVDLCHGPRGRPVPSTGKCISSTSRSSATRSWSSTRLRGPCTSMLDRSEEHVGTEVVGGAGETDQSAVVPRLGIDPCA
jgi:hypothetical protein